MRTAIIGSGRNRNGIGQYIGKYFQKNGANVISVLGTTKKSAQKAASALTRYGINATSYTDFYTMAEKERPEAVVIASPTPSHLKYLLQCIETGVHVFCEKPFIHQDENDMDISLLLENIFEKAEPKNLKMAMNSQWPFSLPFYESLCGPVEKQKSNTFFIRLSPMVSGKEMILDSVPHVLSMLYYVFDDGQIDNLNINGSKDKITLKFNYIFPAGRCAVWIELVRTVHQPRDFSYGFNNKIVHRVIDLNNYDIFFTYSDRILKISDPLELSVRDFISAVRDNREPRIGKSHIVNNIFLLKKIYNYSQAI